MYANDSAKRLSLVPAFVLWMLGSALFGNTAAAQPQVVRNITQANERLELTVNTSRILTLDKRIPRMVVNNPELVTVTALSANQVQLAARKPGVTQVNLWDEDDQVYTVDVLIYGDVRELELAFDRLFPGASVKVMRLTNSLVLEGFVERPEDVGPIIRLAEDYAPKIVNNITVGGVQQVMLKVKVMEVSRTKLRSLGVDWTQISGSSVVSSSVAGVSAASETFRFGVVDGSDSFFAFFDALQQNNLAKILADPTITTVSGRAAKFLVGGELPIIVPSGLNQTTIEYKDFGTQVDFVPIVLGNGNIRLEVRSEVSEIDDTRSIVLDGFSVPALKTSYVDTGVEMKAGQSLALAGLVQTRVDAVERGLPFVSDLPYIGAAFRSVEEEVNEIELLVLVTPELVDGLEPNEVPPCGPGMESVSPTNCQLYFGAHLEVPSCGPCGPDCYGNCQGGCNGSCGTNCNGGCGDSYSIPSNPGPPALVTDEITSAPRLPRQSGQAGQTLIPVPAYEGLLQSGSSVPNTNQRSVPRQESMQGPRVLAPSAQQSSSSYQGANVAPQTRAPVQTQRQYQMPAQYSREIPQYRTSAQPSTSPTSTPGLIGPIGYDLEK